MSLILPHLMYCFAIWVPTLNSVDLHSLKSTQKFALRMCFHNWIADYLHLLQLNNLPSLSTHYSISWLTLLYKILNRITYFPNNIFILAFPPPHSSRYFHPFNIVIPFSRTSASLHSFVPSTSWLWNSLPHHIKSAASCSLKDWIFFLRRLI